MTDERLDEIKTKWNIPVTLPMSVPWGKDDVVWLVGEVTRLRAEAQRADEEATALANSDLATTEQIVRALRVENDALRAKVRTITEHYKPGWVDGLKAVARSAGFDPDDAPHDAGCSVFYSGGCTCDLAQKVVAERDAAREEVARLRAALEAVLGRV